MVCKSNRINELTIILFDLFQTVCNALWYITNQHTTINDCSKHKSNVVPVDKCWSPFEGYNDVKRKKMKQLPLSSSSLEGHASALLEICMKPCMESNTTVKVFRNDIQGLADCLGKYSAHLKLQLKKQTERHNQLVPARLVCENVSVQHRNAVTNPDSCYLLLVML